MGEVVNLVDLRAAAEADADDFIRGLEMLMKAIKDAKQEPGGFPAFFQTLSEAQQAQYWKLPELLDAYERRLMRAGQRTVSRRNRARNNR